ncbi:hypothetical protein [Neomicrococcus lactis]
MGNSSLSYFQDAIRKAVIAREDARLNHSEEGEEEALFLQIDALHMIAIVDSGQAEVITAETLEELDN